jgi:iron(III) transport system substrate-binding protein
MTAFRTGLIVGAVLAYGLAGAARAGNLENPSYPMNANEQLFAELAKLPAAERHAKLVEGAKKEGKMEIIQTLPGQLGRSVTKVYRDAYTFVKVQETNLGTNFAMERLVTEERAGKHLTDVTGGDLTEATYPLEEGFIARNPTPAVEKILPQYKSLLDKHHRWVAYSWLEKGISFNADMIKEADAPKEWADLCKPAYKGQFSMEPIRTRVVTFLHSIMGEDKFVEWMQCLGKNEPIIMRGATVRMELMLAGDHAIQGENAFYTGVAYNKKKGGKGPFRMVLSTPVMAQPSSCVVNRNAANPHASALFCDTLLEKDVQQIMLDNYRNPMTMPSAFMPTEVTLIPVAPIPVSEAERLVGMWKKYVSDKK